MTHLIGTAYFRSTWEAERYYAPYTNNAKWLVNEKLSEGSITIDPTGTKAMTKHQVSKDALRLGPEGRWLIAIER